VYHNGRQAQNIAVHQNKYYWCIAVHHEKSQVSFTWEQRKLGELVDRVVRKNSNNESSLPLTISAQYGLVDQITYFNNRVASRDVSNYYLVMNGEFAYNKSTSDGFPFGAVKRLDLYEKGVLSTLYIVFGIKNTEETNSDFLTVFFDTDRWHKGVAERAAEGARNHGLLNISADDFFDIDLYVPKLEKEQAAIGAYMRSLDNLITLHQRECARVIIGCCSRSVCCTKYALAQAGERAHY
jgi:type I restriction enzyme S subunit